MMCMLILKEVSRPNRNKQKDSSAKETANCGDISISQLKIQKLLKHVQLAEELASHILCSDCLLC